MDALVVEVLCVTEVALLTLLILLLLPERRRVDE